MFSCKNGPAAYTLPPPTRNDAIVGGGRLTLFNSPTVLRPGVMEDFLNGSGQELLVGLGILLVIAVFLLSGFTGGTAEGFDEDYGDWD